ncbi:hypothetical protein [Streptomyces sviceus]
MSLTARLTAQQSLVARRVAEGVTNRRDGRPAGAQPAHELL